MRRALVIALGFALLAAVPVRAAVVERLRVADVAGPLAAGLPSTISVVLNSPPDYVRASAGGAQGVWRGPRYAASANAAVGGDTAIAWTARAVRAKTAESAAPAALVHGWPKDIDGGVSIPHRVGNRTIGTILGHYIVTQAPGGSSFEAAVAFALAPGIFATVRFEATGPPGDAAGAGGVFLVDGIPASLWNRGQSFWAITGAELRGTLAPTRVTVRADATGRVLRGAARDAFGHPVVRARIELQRRSGGWRTVSATRTSATGSYVMRGLAARGRYRVVASLGTTAVRSAVIVAGPRGAPSSRS